jgi:hypothetical protein
VGSQRVADSERVVGEYYQLEVADRPTRTNPQLGISLRRRVEVEFSVQEVHAALRAERRPVKFLYGLLWLGASGLSIHAGREMVDGDTLTTDGKIVVAVGALAGLYGLIGVLDGINADEPTPLPGETALGDTRSDREFGPYQPVSDAVVEVSAPGVARTLTTDTRGMASLNVVEDLGWSSFAEPTRIRMSVASPRASAPIDVSLDIGEWTTPCVVTTGSGSVYEGPTASALVIGEFGPSERFDLYDTTGVDWLEISYRGGTGFIPVLAAERCWYHPG